MDTGGFGKECELLGGKRGRASARRPRELRSGHLGNPAARDGEGKSGHVAVESDLH